MPDSRVRAGLKAVTHVHLDCFDTARRSAFQLSNPPTKNLNTTQIKKQNKASWYFLLTQQTADRVPSKGISQVLQEIVVRQVRTEAIKRGLQLCPGGY